MIAKGLITQRANDERLAAQTIERDYVLAHICAKPRKLKLDISDTELVESRTRIDLQPRWPDLPEGTAIDAYTLDEVAADTSRHFSTRLDPSLGDDGRCL